MKLKHRQKRKGVTESVAQRFFAAICNRSGLGLKERATMPVISAGHIDGLIMKSHPGAQFRRGRDRCAKRYWAIHNSGTTAANGEQI
jgi:hypothetical protein